MTDRRDLLIAGVLAAVLLATAAVGPTLVDARPAYEIPVHEAAAGDDLSNASGSEWNEVSAASVSLSSAGAAVPAADNVTVEQVRVGAARTEERLFLRVSWEDATNDSGTGDVREFADAVAVQLPADADERPPIAMGGTDNMVNVWYWSADGSSEELLAGGPGTTTGFNRTRVATDAAYDDGRWYVVLSRPLDASGNRTAVPTDEDMDIGVAVWNGSNAERSGQKAVSEWYYLALGPGPAGPPYETILWVVAGLAIVVSALVTVEGVRRTRGE
ncbi:ethylbenzene dehydrogenase-related protein [Halostella salina]|uniref:ethylbenzene dehydrogenase-related protein n=1 Tax=Halostella salina TaxID=1547897 RepID=UPI000EF7E892|nr:ethylbenzene dehydrogenase-related protein [Halostella salina]